MKKIITIVLGLTLIFGFTSCGKTEKDIEKAVKQYVEKELSSMGYYVSVDNVSIKRTKGGSFIEDILGSGSFLNNMLGTGNVYYSGKCNCTINSQRFSLDVNAVVHQNGDISPMFDRWSFVNY